MVHFIQEHLIRDEETWLHGLAWGTFAERPEPEFDGRLYFATDKGIWYRDNGSDWEIVSYAMTAEEKAKLHRKWSWSDEQAWMRTFSLPFVKQYDWNKQGAIFEKQAPVAWDDDYVQHPCVVKLGDNWYLFYSGGGLNPLAKASIGVAVANSPFGPFIRAGENPLFPVPSGFFGRIAPSVIYDYFETDPNKKWKMWFVYGSMNADLTLYYSHSSSPIEGWSTPTSLEIPVYWGQSVFRVGRLFLAFIPKLLDKKMYLWMSNSPDSGWVVKEVALDLGSSGEWDDTEIVYLSVTYIFGCFYILYSGYGGYPVRYRIGMALSDPPSSFYDFWKYKENPILNFGGAGDPDESHVFAPSIQQEDEKWYLFYCGINPSDRKICLATIP